MLGGPVVAVADVGVASDEDFAHFDAFAAVPVDRVGGEGLFDLLAAGFHPFVVLRGVGAFHDELGADLAVAGCAVADLVGVCNGAEFQAAASDGEVHPVLGEGFGGVVAAVVLEVGHEGGPVVALEEFAFREVGGFAGGFAKVARPVVGFADDVEFGREG